jgi:superkiller protein 3
MNGGKREAAFLLCREIAARSPNASWAIKRSGFLSLDKCTTTTSNGLEQQEKEQEQQEYQQQYAEQAINSFQKALRVRPGDAACWEGLGAAYQLQGRLTAALKAHSRAIQLDEGRVYAAVQCGRLHLALGSLPEALESFQSAIKTEQCKSQGEREGADGVESNGTSIKTNSINPAALLGAAQVEIAIAAVDIGLGATIAAADTLGNATDHAYTCATTVGYSTIHSAWKLVGDALLLHAETSPSEKTREIVYGKILLNNSRTRGGGDGEKDTTKITATTSGNNASVSDLLESWKGRMHAVKAASRVYAKALFLRPSNAGSWRDVALALHHQALLIDQLPPHTNDDDDNNKQSSLALSQQAERMLHAAIRAFPTSSSTWAALGIVLPLYTPSFAKKEYALSRALQLDPRNTTAWVALSRLYLSTGELGLAQDALRNARTHDPTESSIWDAMSAVAAARGDYESGLEYAEHSMLLGGGNNGSRRRSGGEGMLAFVYGAIMHTGLMLSMKGALYAVAKKLPVVRPLEAGAHVACGLACESRGDWNGAVGCYNTAIELLVSSDDRREVECNLARALTGAGEYEEAIALYEKLLVVSPSSYVAAAETWLGYARALLLSCCGESGSESLAKHIVVLVLEKAMVIVEQQAIPAAVAQQNGDCAVEAIALILQIEYIRTSGECADVDVVSVCLMKYLPLLREMDNPPPEKEKVERLWCIAGAIIATTGNVGKTVDCLYQATTSSSPSLPAPRSAAFENSMQCIIAAAALLSASSSTEHHQQHITTSAERYLTKAIHTSPWNVPLRTSLAAMLSDSTNISTSTNGSTLRSKLASRVVSLNQALSTKNNKENTNTILPWNISAVETAIEARTSSLLNNSTTLKKTIHKELVVLAKYLHAHPVDAKSWYLGAVLATQLASLNMSTGGGSGSGSSYYYCAMALSWCRSALGRVQQKLHTKGNSNSNNAMWQLMKARVQLCMSDCLLHSPVTGANSDNSNKKPDGGGALLLAESVYQCMIKAQEEEGGGGNGSSVGAIAAAAQRQIARCHWAEGSIQSAEYMYKQAIQQHNDMLSVLELSQLLLTSSSGDVGEGKQKAAELLNLHATSSPLSHKAALMMQLALTHASLQEWEQAKEPVRNMMIMATSTAAGGDALLHSDYKEHSYTAATVLAIICLQQALSQQQQQEQQQQETDGKRSSSIQLIGEARRALLDAINNNYENDGVVVRTLLAQVESVGTTRKKEEKVAAHINVVKDMMSDGDSLDVDASHQLLHFLNTLL